MWFYIGFGINSPSLPPVGPLCGRAGEEGGGAYSNEPHSSRGEGTRASEQRGHRYGALPSTPSQFTGLFGSGPVESEWMTDMRRLACGAEMHLIEVEAVPDESVMVPRYEHHTFESCRWHHPVTAP